jgi:hypothetical protein
MSERPRMSEGARHAVWLASCVGAVMWLLAGGAIVMLVLYW